MNAITPVGLRISLEWWFWHTLNWAMRNPNAAVDIFNLGLEIFNRLAGS